ncbi:unnamed protein product, partial [marine sediment metagenome]
TYSTIVSATQNFSVSLWFKTSATSRVDPFGALREGGANDPRIIIYTNVVEGKIGFQILGDGGTQLSTSGSTTINDGGWHHAVLIVTPTTQKLYIDNSLEINGTTNTGTITLTDTAFFIGNINARNIVGGTGFLGVIDEVAIFTDLNSTSVTDLYNSGNCLPYSEEGEISVSLISPSNNTQSNDDPLTFT